MTAGVLSWPAINLEAEPYENKLSTADFELLFWLDLVQRDERAKQSDTHLGE